MKKAVDSKTSPVISRYFSTIAKQGHAKMAKESPDEYFQRQSRAGQGGKGKGLGKRGKYKRIKKKRG